MGKIILTETQYKRLQNILVENVIDKSTLKEDAGWGLATTSALLGPIGWIYGALNSGASGDKAKAIFEKCKTSKGKLGTRKMKDEYLKKIADKINNAVEGLGTTLPDIKSSFNQIESIADLCALTSIYYRRHGESLFDALDGDIDREDEWKSNVFLPLLDKAAKNTKMEMDNMKKQKTSYGAESVGGGAGYSQQSDYVVKSDDGDTFKIPQNVFYTYKEGKQGASFKLPGNKWGWFGCPSKIFLIDNVKYKDVKGYLANNIVKAICGSKPETGKKEYQTQQYRSSGTNQVVGQGGGGSSEYSEYV